MYMKRLFAVNNVDAMLKEDGGSLGLADGGICLSICWTALLIWVKCTVINDASGQTSQRRYFTLEEKRTERKIKAWHGKAVHWPWL